MKPNKALCIEAANETSAAFSYCGMESLVDMRDETGSDAQPMREFRELVERSILNVDNNFLGFCRRIQSEATTAPLKFLQITVFLASYFQLYHRSFKNTYEFLFFHKGEIATYTDSWKALIEGPSDDAWTIAEWVSNFDQECMLDVNQDIEKVRSELTDLLEGLKQGKPIEGPCSLLDAAEQVANQYDEAEHISIEEWAEKLAKDLSRLSD